MTTLSDVYGLGAVLYALLTGKPPFDGDSAMETLDNLRQQQPVPPSQINSKVPCDLEIICLKCMDKDPQRRYPSAQALAADLTRFLVGEPIQARPASALEKGWRWCRRRPVIAGLTAALAVAVLGGLVGTSLGLVAAVHARQDALNREQDAVKAQAKERAQTELAEQRLYDVRMTLVQRYWEDSNGDLLHQGLDEQLPASEGGVDRRGFEWFYWQRKVSWGRLTLENAHPDRSGVVAFSPDGGRLASLVDGRTVKVWEIGTGQEIRTLEGLPHWVRRVVFSPDGKRVAAGGIDEVKVWDVGTGQQTVTVKAVAHWVGGMAFSPDGKHIAASGNGVKVWDAGTGEETLALKGHTGWVTSVAFSPDGKHLASGSLDKTLKVWDGVTAQTVLTLKGHTGGVTCVAFSPDGKRIGSGGEDGTVKVWDPGTGRDRLTLTGHTYAVTFLVFSPDGQRIATGDEDFFGDESGISRGAKVWDSGTGQEIRTLVGCKGIVRGVAFSSDGKPPYFRRSRWVGRAMERRVRAGNTQAGGAQGLCHRRGNELRFQANRLARGRRGEGVGRR